MAMAGAQALQLEDSADMEESTKLLPREQYYAKVRAALAALEGTNCFLIARTNADPATELDEGIERCKEAIKLGAQMTTVVKLTNLKDAAYVAKRVPGWKMYPDVAGKDGVGRSHRRGHLPARLQFHDDALHAESRDGRHARARQAQLRAAGVPVHLRQEGRDRHHGHERYAAVRSARLHGARDPLQPQEKRLHIVGKEVEVTPKASSKCRSPTGSK